MPTDTLQLIARLMERASALEANELDRAERDGKADPTSLAAALAIRELAGVLGSMLKHESRAAA